MKLPEFNQYAICPKCAFGEVKSRFIAVGTEKRVVFLGVEELRAGIALCERIQRCCARCKYRWAEAALGGHQNEQPSLAPTDYPNSQQEPNPC